MKWARREPWAQAFGDVMENHLGPACANADIEIDQLADVIGDDWSSTLFGCAFEDFLTRDIDPVGNVVDDYLKRRGWSEKVRDRAYMAGLRSSVMSLYEVSDVTPGESFLARDLFREGDPVLISERTASQTLKQWSRIAARVVEERGKLVIGGGLLSFNFDLSDTLLDSLDRIRGEAPDRTGVLRLAAPSITTVWLDDLLEKTLNPKSPEWQNSDGEDLEFLSLHYRLLPGVSAERISDALDAVPELRAASATFWNWLSAEDTPLMRATPGAEAGFKFVSTSEDGYVVLGSLELKGGTLVLSANSEARAEHGRAMFAPVLKGLVREPLVERQTLEQFSSDHRDDEPAVAPDWISPEDKRRIVHENLDRHYREQLDEPIPALGDVTPRHAANSDDGREKVVAWLKRLENLLLDREPTEPMADYDVAWLWEELGISEHRK